MFELLFDPAGRTGGLTGTYYDGTDFGEKRFQRVDETIDFDWGDGAPDDTDSDQFSIRWTGKFRPNKSGEYLFLTWSDDGIRLWVNGEQIIDDWTGHGTQRNMGAIKLEAGTSYDIKLEYSRDRAELMSNLAGCAYPKINNVGDLG